MVDRPINVTKRSALFLVTRRLADTGSREEVSNDRGGSAI